MERKVGKKICDVFNQFRLKKRLCDAVLLTVDGDEFHAHKIILCGCSAYFRALFTNSFYPSDQHTYRIPGVSAHIIELIIEYVYVRRVTITEGNAFELLIAADYLGVSDLVKECCEFLKAQISLERYIDIWRLAHFYSFKELKQQAFQSILLNFDAVQASEEFLDLTVEQLSEIIENDNLNVRHESLVFEAVMKWAGHAPTERKAQMLALLSKVRMRMLKFDYFVQNVKDNILVTNDAASRAFIDRVFMVMCGLNPSTCLSPEITRPRLPSSVLLVIGGWSTYPMNPMEAYDSRTDRWICVSHQNWSPRSHHGTVFLNGFVYCIGGHDGENYLDSVLKLDPITRTWEEVSPMHLPRCFVSACVLDGQIHIIGGFDGNKQLSAVERYDPQNDQWTMIAPMGQQRSEAQVTVLNGNIYVCGGFDGEDDLSTAEYYSPKMGQWTFLPNMNSCRTGAGVSAFGGELYVVGGSDDVTTLRSAEVYNPQSNSWRNISSMITQRCDFSMEVIDNCLYAVGGYVGTRYTKKVEYYDNKTDKWYAVKSLRISRTGMSSCVVSGLPNMADYITPQDVSYSIQEGFHSKRRRC